MLHNATHNLMRQQHCAPYHNKVSWGIGERLPDVQYSGKRSFSIVFGQLREDIEPKITTTMAQRESAALGSVTRFGVHRLSNASAGRLEKLLRFASSLLVCAVPTDMIIRAPYQQSSFFQIPGFHIILSQRVVPVSGTTSLPGLGTMLRT